MSRYHKKAFLYTPFINVEIVKQRLPSFEFPLSMRSAEELMKISAPSIEVVIYIDAITRNKQISSYKSKLIQRGMNYWKIDEQTLFNLIDTYNKTKSEEIPFAIYEQCLQKFGTEKARRKSERYQKNYAKIDNKKIKEIMEKEIAEWESRMAIINRIMGVS